MFYDTTCLDILETIYLHPSIHKRAIAKKISRSMPAVQNALKKMKQIIIEVHSGNRHEYSLNYKKRELDSTLSLIEERRFQRLPKNVQYSIEEFIHALPEKPLIAILFGSQATMTASKDSDIDIMLVFQKLPETETIEKAARMTSLKTNKTVNPVYLDYITFAHESHDETKEFFKRIKKDKIIIIGTNWWRNIENEKA